MPVGEYLLEDGRLIVVKEEGMIDDVREVSDEVPQKEEESKDDPKDETEDLKYKDEEMRDDGEEAAVDDWQGMEKRIKNLEDAIADLKAKVGEENVEASEDVKEELNEEVKEEVKEELNEQLKEELSKPAAAPIKHNPESGNAKKEHFRIAPKRRPSTMDYILNQLNK